MSDEKPLSYVENRITKTYPTELGAPKFEPTDVSLFNQEKLSNLKNHFTSKFNDLTNQWKQLLEEVQINEMIYSSKYNFQPTVGKIYHLYQNNNEKFLSLISPSEWGTKFEFLGSFQFNFDGRWIKV